MAGQMVGELGGGILGGLLGGGSRGGSSSGPGASIATASGTVSIVPDARLNALIVQAGPQDLMLIDQLLEVIDRPDSPEDIKLTNSAAIIPVIYQDASQVADTVKSVYADRIQQGGSNRQPNPQDFINAITRGGRGGGGQQREQEPPKMTVGVDKHSNSLVVSGPPHLIAEVQSLVEALDQAGATQEESVEVVALNGTVNPEMMQKTLRAVMGQKVSTTSTPSSSSNNNNNSSSGSGGGSNSEEEARQRIEMFRQMRERMMGGGGGFPFGGGGPPGSSPFGGSSRGGPPTGGFPGGGFRPGGGFGGGDRGGGR